MKNLAPPTNTSFKLDMDDDPATPPVGRIVQCVNRFNSLLDREQPIQLKHFLLLAFLLRIPAVLFSQGYEFMDHQFQSVDPAYHLAFGNSWWKTWEYEAGMRSWLYPGMLAGMLRAFSAVGIEHPLRLMTASRFVHAIISLLPMWSLWMLIVRWCPVPRPNPVLLLVAASGLTIFSGVQPNGTAIAVTLSLSAIFMFHGPGFRWGFGAGLALGLAFACRFQDAFFGPVLFIGGLCLRRWRESVGLAAGCIVTITLQGVVDYYTYGIFLISPFRYVDINVFQGVSSRFGSKPSWYYLRILAGLLVCIPPFIRIVKNAIFSAAKEFPLPFVCATAYLVLHSIVARKAFRFLVPVFVLMLFLLAVGAFRRTANSRLERWHRRLVVGSQILFSLVLSFAFFHRGPIEAALWLRDRDDFQEHLVMVNGSYEDVGGHLYLDRDQLDVTPVSFEQLAGFLNAFAGGDSVYLVSVVQPIPASIVEKCLQYHWAVDHKIAIEPWPNLKQKRRRFIYLASRQ